MCIILCISMLFSCRMIPEGSNDGSGGAAGGGSEDGPNGDGDVLIPDDAVITENTIWAPGRTLYAVSEKGLTWDAQSLLNEIQYDLGVTVSVVSDTSAPAGSEFVIGRTEREISKRAYRNLERRLEEEPGATGWLIYSMNGSLCIAYERPFMAQFAVDYLVNTLLPHKVLTLDNGVVACKVESLSVLAEQEMNKIRAEGFEKVEEAYGAEAAEAAKQLYSLFTADTYKWLASLYDPEIGGFYYSASGRDNYGFLPDIESTGQVLGWLPTAGFDAAYNYDLADGLPKKFTEKVIEFTQSLQSEDDGYFYHPQWGKDIGVSRLSRDLMWATNILSALGARPYYNTPNGVSGFKPKSASALTSPLGTRTAEAVSKPLAVASSSALPHLQSLDAFKKYLVSLEINKHSYASGNELTAQGQQIRAKGVEYVDAAINYLNSIQNPENGLWEDEVTYSSVNGLMKIGSFYRNCERPIPNTRAALDSALAISLDMENYVGQNVFICSVYNTFIAMGDIIKSARINEKLVQETGGRLPAAELSEAEARAKIAEHAVDLLKVSYDKLVPMRNLDGGFSYMVGQTSTTSQGALVSVAGICESDINATSIAFDTMSSMFAVLGVERPDFYSAFDGEIFLESLVGMGEIIKDPPPAAETFTFDDLTPEDAAAMSQYGVLKDVNEYITNGISDSEIVITETDSYYRWFKTAIVQNPAPGAKEGDYVFKANTFVESESSDKKYPAYPSYTAIKFAADALEGECYVFDSDILLGDFGPNNEQWFMQIFYTDTQLHGAFSIGFLAKRGADGKGYISVAENSAYPGLDGKVDYNLATGIPVGEWFNFRLEVYKIRNSDGSLNIRGKIYVNGKYQSECDCGYIESGNDFYSEINYDKVQISYYRTTQSEIYFNDLFAARIDKDYLSAIPGTPMGPEDPDKKTEPITFDDVSIKDFEPLMASGVFLKPYVGIENKLGDSEKIEGTEIYKWFHAALEKDPTPGAAEGNQVFHAGGNTYPGTDKTVASWASLTDFTLGVDDENGQCYVFETDMMLANASPMSDGTYVAELYFAEQWGSDANGFAFIIQKDGDKFYLRIAEKYAGLNGSDSAVVDKIPIGEWFNIRIEVYKIYDSAGELYTMRTKFYIDGEYRGESDSGNVTEEGAYVDKKIAKIEFAYYKYANTDFYFDNIYMARIARDFVSEEPGGGVIVPPPATDENEPTKPITFDEVKLDELDMSTGVVASPYVGISNSIADGTKDESTGKYKFFGSIITSNPAPGASAADYVLKSSVYRCPDEDKTIADYASMTEITLGVDDKEGLAYVFETDMMIGDDFGPGDEIYFAQIFFANARGEDTNSFNLLAKRVNGAATVTIGENSSYPGLNGTQWTIASGIDASGWFKLRFEVYKIYDGGNVLSVKTKIFVNDEYVGESDGGLIKDGAYADRAIAKVKLSYYRTSDFDLYLNNIYAARIAKTYAAETPDQGTTDPPSGGGETTDPENPGTGEGGETTDPENPGAGEGGETTDPENPGTGEGGETADPDTPVTPPSAGGEAEDHDPDAWIK